jgi:endonuclease III related protein
MEMYGFMLDRFGPQGWWPADSPFEMMVGAVLTQNTNWGNVERAIGNLQRERLLEVGRLNALTQDALAAVIRPAGYFNIKAARLKNLVRFIVEQYQGEVEAMLRAAPDTLRAGLLEIKGIGPETADSIALYAAGHPFFVVDAYTHRILARHGMAGEEASYHELQEMIMDSLPVDVPLYREFHALIVKTGKECCRRKPRCDTCPLEGL